MSRIPQLDEHKVSKLPVITLAARVLSFASLVVSAVILRTNDETSDGYIVRFKDFASYKYAFYCMLLALAYTILQLPFALYFLVAKRRLISLHASFQFDFYCDKVISLVLATALGTLFGATWEVKKLSDDNDGPKFRNFFNMAIISAVFLLIGSSSYAISSFVSSMALPN